MFKEAGLSAPPKNFDELINFSQAMAKGEKTGFLTLNFDWLYWPLMKMNGIELLTPDLKKPAFNTPETIAVLERLAKATENGGINKIAWTGRWVEPNGAFASGTVGMLHAHSAVVLLRQGAGPMDQSRHAGRGADAGRLVDADQPRLRRLQDARRIPTSPLRWSST